MRRGRRSRVGALALAVWMFGSAIVLGIVCLPLLLAPRRASFTPIRLWAKGSIAALRVLVGARVEIRGRERLPRGACLVAAKHQGMLDILVALTLFEDPCIVLKRELMAIPIFGWYARTSGMIPIDRAGGATAIRTMTRLGREALAHGRQVVVYPEGTRTEPGAPAAYKSGVAGLYRDFAVPCAPLATNSGLVWPAEGLAKHAGTAVYEVLDPIPPGLKRAAFMAELEGRVESASTALLAEGAPSRFEALRGCAGAGPGTDEIMALTRDDP